MPNKHVGASKHLSHSSGGTKGGTKGSKVSAAMHERPGFPGAGLPGKPGPDRSAGVRKVKQHPKSEGL